MLHSAKVGTFLYLRKFFSKKKLTGTTLPAPLRCGAYPADLLVPMHSTPFHVEHVFGACPAALHTPMHSTPFHVEHGFGACPAALLVPMRCMLFHVEHGFGAYTTPLQAPMHSVPQPTPLRARARGTPLQAPMHSVPQPAPLRARARGTPLQAPMHSALCPTPLRAPSIALHSAGVSRLKVVPSLAGAMRMSAKPPLIPSRRGLSPRGRDTPASLRSGRAGARPGGGAPFRRAQHYTHGHLPLRFGGTRAPFRGQRHYAHGHLPLR